MSGLPGVEAGGRDVAACTAHSGHRTAMDFLCVEQSLDSFAQLMSPNEI